MPQQLVRYSREGPIAYITLDRPEALNAVNRDLENDLAQAFSVFDNDVEAWVAILHGEGNAFCAGADIKERFANTNRSDRDEEWGMGQNPEGFLGRCINWKPVIAAVHGHCLAWGLLIATECDLIVASDDATFGLTETLRSFPGGSAWAKLHTFMPSKIATEMLLTGESISASELHRLGLINKLAPCGSHLSVARDLANKILRVPPLAVRSGVRVTRWPWVRNAADADYYQASQKLHLTQDFEESAKAFIEKREPKFKGE